MALKIGQLIKKVAEGQGLSQSELGKKINLTKQGVASIYRRSTIDTELLRLISGKLNYDFFAHFYEQAPLAKFRQAERAEWEARLQTIATQYTEQSKILEAKDEVIEIQRKYIAELEGKLKKK